MDGWRQIGGKFLAAFALGVLLCGCASYDDPYHVHSVWRPADASDSRADVFFLTDRKPNPNWLPDRFDRVRGDVSCGAMQAALPTARQPGGEVGVGRLLRLRDVGGDGDECGACHHIGD